jgi:hypothetical protein
MKSFEDQSQFDKELKSLHHKLKLSENEQFHLLHEINEEIVRNASPEKPASKWIYSIAAAISVFIFILLAFPQFHSTDLAGKGELIGETFRISYPPVFQNADTPGRYHTILNLEFIDGHTVQTKRYGEGTYELTGDNILLLQFENENERLQISFELRESEKDFSTYAAEIKDVVFEMDDWNKVSYFRNFAYSLPEGMPLEFITD